MQISSHWLSISSQIKPVPKTEDSGFGKFGKNDGEYKAEPTAAVENAMGFQGFGKNKGASAKNFDLESLVDQSKQTARERSLVKIKEQEDSTSSGKDQEDEELTGPPVPPPGKSREEIQITETKNKKKKPTDSDDKEDDSSDGDEEATGTFIPASLEVNLNHGSKTVSALSIDHSGACLVTGSVDYDVNYGTLLE